MHFLNRLLELLRRLMFASANSPLHGLSLQREELNPVSVEQCTANCLARHAAGQSAEAFSVIEAGLLIFPDAPSLHHFKGNLLFDAGLLDEAMASYKTALALSPDYPGVLHNMALIQELRGSLDLAWLSRGAMHQGRGEFTEALATLERAIKINPFLADAHCRRATILYQMDCYAEAVAAFDRVLVLNSDHVEAIWRRGLALQFLGSHAEAKECYQRAITIDPDCAEAHWRLGLVCLLYGDFSGWNEYEWRWKSVLSHEVRGFSQPLWLGKEDLAGKTLLVHAEQGLGDTLQFCRYIHLLVEFGAQVIFEVQPELKRLLRCMEGPVVLLSKGEPLPKFDLHCPLLSLPLALGPQFVLSHPGSAYVFLPPDHDRVKRMLRLIPMPPNELRIGLVWSGNPKHRNDRNRSIALSCFLSAIPTGPVYYSLQKEIIKADREVLATRRDIHLIGEHFDDFVDTALAIKRLDLVVSVDTSVAHLAGALGCPVWILLSAYPDWRWLIAGGTTGWYESAHLFRQGKQGDWSSPLFDVSNRIDRLLLRRGLKVT